MMFGDQLAPADSAAPAGWLESACRGKRGSIGTLVPNHYESFMRVWAPAPVPGDWWSLYRDLFTVVARVGLGHTTTPDEAWFGIWEGHGFDRSWSRIAHFGPLDDDARRELDLERARLLEEDRRRNTAIREGLDRIPKFDRPGRAHHLVRGPVMAVAALTDPSTERWRNPDLFWPADRAWFAGTDVDFWSLYIGGTTAFTTDLAEAVPTRSEPVPLDDLLEIED